MFKLNRLLVVFWALAVCLFVSPALAEPNDEFLDIVFIIHEGDALQKEGKAARALSKYNQAQTNLLAFRKRWPAWNTRMVTFRLAYLNEKLSPPEQTATPAAPVKGSSAPKKAAPKKAALIKEPVAIKLLEAGGDERAALRLKAQVGDQQALEIQAKIGMEIKIGESQLPASQLPPTKMPLEITVKSVAENGDISYEILLGEVTMVEEAGANPQVVQAMKTAMSGMKGVSGTGKISNRGVSLAMNIKPMTNGPQAQQVAEQVVESLANFSLPFPEEPVGKGAKWQATRSLKSQGMTIKQTTTYELVSREGDLLTIKVTDEQSAGSQKVQSPVMPGVQMEVVQMSGTGSGEIKADLVKAFPTQGNLTTHSETSLSMNAAGKQQAMTMQMDLSVRLEGKP